ncbi:zinc-binding dehydrogenase [Verticiella sediminum]|uniref:Zinc-binding dehydrogenase n=1 Tax=Verticiella sediminum TaxID=1247510 RepID=A0A556A5W0_9BURK|nr:zinc-binding dehydrogenase [Verticiella sediminum]TSH88257.1 zinc-binding dehydrogenase [Verticiella sediminum]
MPAALPDTQLQLRSLVTPEGELQISLVRVPVPAPASNEVLVRMQATPINPSDMGLLLAGVDPATLVAAGSDKEPMVKGQVPAAAMPGFKARLGASLAVGNEGAGVVVAAGESPEAQALLGKTVAILGGAMYQQYRSMRAQACLVLEDGTRPSEAASCFVNPLTALSMVETMRLEGHTALVHTAAASNLGQMLNRICLADGIGLVCIVRKPEQAALLREQGAKWVVDSSAPDFAEKLVDAIAGTGATLAFDAIGGGRLPGQILAAMETVLNRSATEYSRYGSPVHKQVYLYGNLDRGPTVIERGFGMAWGVGGWLLTPFLQRIGLEATQRLRARVAAELRTTFASRYTDEISLADALKPEVIARYGKAATGSKFLINPTLDA